MCWISDAAFDHRELLITVRSSCAVSSAVWFEPTICLLFSCDTKWSTLCDALIATRSPGSALRLVAHAHARHGSQVRLRASPCL